jgi:hypothetical protein
MQAWLSDLNEGALLCILLLLLQAGAELGFLLAERTRRAHGEVSAHASAVQGAVLGLLALLLGFTFSLAMSRFEVRKEILRDEANAIGTTYLRAQLMPEPMRTRLRTQLRTYLTTRFELHDISHDSERVGAVHVRAAALHQQMWGQLTAAADAHAEPEFVSLLADALNQTIDLHAVRVAAIRNRIPGTIFLLLLCVAIISMGLTGYASAPNHRQSFALNALVTSLIALVMLLIVDLHRPTRGLITLGTAALDDLRESMR